jgi:hypothetical protein
MMSECAQESYKGYRITAAACLNPVAGDCWQLQPLYRPLAQIAWRSAGVPHEKRLGDKHLYPDPDDAKKVALALAKRYIDQLDSHRKPPDADPSPVPDGPVRCPDALDDPVADPQD